MKLAHISFYLRFCNNSHDEDSAMLPAISPYGYDNIPQPVRTEARQVTRYGNGPQPSFTELIEHFADGSSFARSA